jgi:hypothetical protein
LEGFFLADGKNRLFGLIEHLLHRQALIEAQLDHFIARTDQLAAKELVHHQSGHLLDRSCGAHPLHQFNQSSVAANLFKRSRVR